MRFATASGHHAPQEHPTPLFESLRTVEQSGGVVEAAGVMEPLLSYLD